MPKPERVGGLQRGAADPAVSEWLGGAAQNRAALSKKQRREGARARVKYDLPPALKEAIDELAKRGDISTSASQLGAFLMAFGLRALLAGEPALHEALREGRSPARTLQFTHNLDIPEEWLP